MDIAVYRGKLKSLVIPALCVGAITFAWLDTSPARQAVDVFQKDVAAHKGKEPVLEREISALTVCSGYLRSNKQASQHNSSPEGRKCLLDALSKVDSAVGALGGAGYTQLFLLQPGHSNDEEVRTAALSAIDKGRAELLRNKAWLYDGYDRVDAAHDRSFLYRVVDGRYVQESTFIKWAERLDRAEFSVRSPEIASRQRDWILKSM